MDIGRISPNARPFLPPTGAEPQAKAPDAPAAFQVDAASLELTLRLNYVQLTETDPNAQMSTVQDLMDKVSQWVHDLFVKNGIEFKQLTPDEAQKQIDDGGEQSPDAVAKRILDFVKGFSDGTPGRAQLLRDAVQKGFGAAGDEWGSKLPDISYKTMDLVRKGMDEMFKPVEKPPEPKPAKPSVDVAA